MNDSVSLHTAESLTISQLNNIIRDVLKMGFPSPVWVCGEIQGYNRNKDKNHIFFELCEKDPVTKDVLARTGLVIFSGRKRYIDDILKSAENAFALKDDIEVKFLCSVDFYPPHGAVRLVVESIDPVYTLGKIAQERQRLIERLGKAGVLEQNKKLPWPEVPLNIGLVTAYDSAAYNDFLSELKASGFAFRVAVRNTLMQGKSTEADVVRALDELNGTDADVIVITRGGGSIADLSCFDSELIARRIAASRLPVLSGIGHEINVTITDLAAHTFQKTPTAAARFLVARVEEFLTGIGEKFLRVIELAGGRIDQERQGLKTAAMNLQNTTNHFLRAHHQQVTRWEEAIRRRPLSILQQAGRDNRLWTEQLGKAARQRFHAANIQLGHYQRMVEMVHPRNTIKRGFSITRTSDGQLVRSCADARRDDAMTTQVLDGLITSRVETAARDTEKEDSHG